MNYHNITKDDMVNGDGLRVVLWTSGCSHHCPECHNPQTWDANSGILFDDSAKKEIFDELQKDYCSGITLSGGDPLNEANIDEIFLLVSDIKKNFPNKTIWLYSGYCFEDIFLEDSPEMAARREILKRCDVFVDGPFVDKLKDNQYHWAGSSNQRVINISKTLLNNGNVVLYDNTSYKQED